MKNYLFVGDPHGDLNFISRAAERAQHYAAEIICVGDWGFLWPGADQLQSLSSVLESAGVTMRFVDGNHDYHPLLREYARNRGTADGAVWLTESVAYQPRGSVHEDADGTRFLFCGGAPSIDKEFRRPGRSWWPEETITTAEHSAALNATGPIHVLVTHDAPEFPPGYGPKGTPEFREQALNSMERVRGLIDWHRPTLHVHGHWHKRYTGQVGRTKVEGLDCNYSFLDDAVLRWNRGD